MLVPKQTVMALATCVLVVAAGCNRAEEKLTPEAAAAKGDTLLREMSKNLSALQAFSYTSNETREAAGSGGAKTTKQRTREVIIRRPNMAVFKGSGEAGDTAGWYDGKQLTLVSSKAKVWARGPMPPTLDEALDFLAVEYAAAPAVGRPVVQLPLRRVDDEGHRRRLGGRAEGRRPNLRSSRLPPGRRRLGAVAQ